MIFLFQVGENNPFSFLAIHQQQTYDGTRRVCYYASSSGSSVIEGTFAQYETKSLFATNYNYMKFDDYRCNC